MQENRWIFIINPVAGRGFASKYTSHVKQMTHQFQINATFTHTKKKKHATALAAEFAEKGFTHIIAVGGDGTVNETASGIIGRDVIFGVVPAGSGNDFVPSLGFHEHFTNDDWRAFFNARTIKIDIGDCNDSYFLNGMGFGFDAQVAADIYKDSEKKGGTGSYFRHIIRNLLRYREKPIRVFRNGKETTTSCFIKTIGIGRRFGGGYLLTAKAIANDGLFDIVTVDKLPLLKRLKLFPKVKKGTHTDDSNIEYYRTDSIEIEAHETVPYHLDGEVFFDKHFSVKLLREKLSVIYNPAGGHYFDEKD
jgi:diacylglycerol kinase (ATP)